MKKHIFTIIVTAVVMAVAIKLSYISRGYFAIGGEWLIWVFPIFCGLASRKEDKKCKRRLTA